jgi:hypothetical protein
MYVKTSASLFWRPEPIKNVVLKNFRSSTRNKETFSSSLTRLIQHPQKYHVQLTLKNRKSELEMGLKANQMRCLIKWARGMSKYTKTKTRCSRELRRSRHISRNRTAGYKINPSRFKRSEGANCEVFIYFNIKVTVCCWLWFLRSKANLNKSIKSPDTKMPCRGSREGSLFTHSMHALMECSERTRPLSLHSYQEKR